MVMDLPFEEVIVTSNDQYVESAVALSTLSSLPDNVTGAVSE
jgi:predicted O-linked N-acetylglucosamine transferase (SPINDLY family)